MLRVKNLVKVKTEVQDGGKGVLQFLSQGLKNFEPHPNASQETQSLFLSNNFRPLG